MSQCKSLVLFPSFVIQRLPAMLPGAVVMPPVSHVETEFQKHYNGLTLEPQDVLHFGRQIASGMVSKHHSSLLDAVTNLCHLPAGVLGQPEHPPQRPCLQEHLAGPRQSAEAS